MVLTVVIDHVSLALSLSRFGCDVGKMMHRKAGVWHENMYLLEEV